jgi:hypothetical protein
MDMSSYIAQHRHNNTKNTVAGIVPWALSTAVSRDEAARTAEQKVAFMRLIKFGTRIRMMQAVQISLSRPNGRYAAGDCKLGLKMVRMGIPRFKKSNLDL